MSEYICLKCDVTVASADRERHSSSAVHVDNGGSPTVVDDDYAVVDEFPGTDDEPIEADTAAEAVPRGMGQTK